MSATNETTVLKLSGLESFPRPTGKPSPGANSSNRGAEPTLGVNRLDRSENPRDGCGFKEAAVEKVA